MAHFRSAPATILQQGRWEQTTVDLQNSSSLPQRCYIYLDRESYLASENDRAQLLCAFNIPEFLNNDTCTKLNGYFGCRGKYNEDGKLESYSTWFRCLVKNVLKPGEETQSGKRYTWYEMGFFTCWDSLGCCRVLCIDTPQDLQSALETVLQKPFLDPRDPFAMHVPLIDQIVKLYDDSVWLIRDEVREIEEHRQDAPLRFGEMHEASRHAIHVTEVLSATIETVEKIQQQQKVIYESLPSDPGKTYRTQAQDYVSFQLEMLKSLKLRSCSNHERMKGEVTLAYHTMAEQDNTVMKSIALLTMTFLPATFVSAFFSTTFFTFGNDGWKVSRQIWLYCGVTIPLTLLVIVAWYFWLRGSVGNSIFGRKWKTFAERRHPETPNDTKV